MSGSFIFSCNSTTLRKCRRNTTKTPVMALITNTSVVYMYVLVLKNTKIGTMIEGSLVIKDGFCKQHMDVDPNVKKNVKLLGVSLHRARTIAFCFVNQRTTGKGMYPRRV